METAKELIAEIKKSIADGTQSKLEFWKDINCEKCDCNSIEEFIRNQLEVIHKLDSITDFTKPFPKHEQLASAAGQRGSAYKHAPDCIRKIIDFIENSPKTYVQAAELGMLVLREQGPSPKVRKRKTDMEISRSKWLLARLQALHWWCCGQEKYESMTSRMYEWEMELERHLKSMEEILGSNSTQPGTVRAWDAEVKKHKEETDRIFPPTDTSPGKKREWEAELERHEKAKKAILGSGSTAPGTLREWEAELERHRKALREMLG